MKAKEFLQQVKKITFEIMMLESELKELYSPISAVRFDNVPGIPDPDATLHIVERIGIIQERYRSKLAELIQKRNECVNIIQQMQDEKAEEVIYLRYVEFKSFGQIARAMNYSKERIFQLQREGLKEIDAILEALQ